MSVFTFIVIAAALLNLVHTGCLQFLAIFHHLIADEHSFLIRTSKTPINTPK